MTDVATLGLAVDSGPVVTATGALQRFAGEAKSAETAANSAANSFVGLFSAGGSAPPKIVSSLEKASASMKLTSWEVKNLGMQMNDTATMMMMGASPFQIIASQGGQVFQVLQNSQGGLRGFASGMMALVTPTNLVAAGLLAAGAGALFWATRTVDATDALDRHTERTRALKSAYDDLVKGQQDLTKSSAAVQQALVDASRVELDKKLKSMASSLSTTLQGIRTADIVSGEFSFDKPIAAFVETVRAGTPDVLRFREELAAIAGNTSMPETVRQGARELIAMTNSAASVQTALTGAAGSIERFGAVTVEQLGSIRAFSAALGTLMNMVPEAAKSVEAGKKLAEATNAFEAGKISLKKQIDSGAIGGLEYSMYLAELKKRYDASIPAISGVTQAQEKLNDQIDAAKARLADSSLASRLGAIDAAYGKQVEDIRKMSMTGASTEQIDGLIAKAKSYRDIQMQLARQQDSFKGGGGKSDAEMFDDIVTRAEGKIAMARMELQAVGLGAQEMVRMKTEQQLLNEAKQRDIDLTPQQVAQIRQLAAAQGQATYAAEQAKKDLDFAKDATKGFMSTLSSGLIQGQGLWKSFGNAAMNVLNKIIDKIETQFVDALFSASGGGGSLFGGLLKGLFSAGSASTPLKIAPFANGGAFTNTVVSSPTMFKFASGTGLMGEAGPEAILPLSRGKNGRLGVVADVPAARSRANDNSAVAPVSLTFKVDNRGASLEAVARMEGKIKDLAASIPATIMAVQRKREVRGMGAV